MSQMQQEKELEHWHYTENDRIHKEFWDKPEFLEKINELNTDFHKRFMENFKDNES